MNREKSLALVVTSTLITRSLERAVVIRSETTPEYITEPDREAVHRYLRGIRPAKGTLLVQFLPDSDALLFEDARHPSVRFVRQTFYESRPPVTILHDSIWFPKWIRDLQVLNV